MANIPFTQIVRKAAKRADVTQPLANLVIRAMLDTMAEILANENHMELPNLGTLELRIVKRHAGLHPATRLPYPEGIMPLALFRLATSLKKRAGEIHEGKNGPKKIDKIKLK